MKVSTQVFTIYKGKLSSFYLYCRHRIKKPLPDQNTTTINLKNRSTTFKSLRSYRCWRGGFLLLTRTTNLFFKFRHWSRLLLAKNPFLKCFQRHFFLVCNMIFVPEFCTADKIRAGWWPIMQYGEWTRKQRMLIRNSTK